MTGTAENSSHHEWLYDVDGVRVVETRVPLWLQESFELVYWPEGQPTPHYFPPRPNTGPLSSVLHLFQTAVGHQKQSLPLPPPVVTQLANSVRSRLGSIYHTSFSLYHVVQYSQTSRDSDYGNGTLYTIHLQIAPKIAGHSELMIKIFKSDRDTDYLVQHSLE